MTAVLGISAMYHDSAAALVVDGQIVAAAQEERLGCHPASYRNRPQTGLNGGIAVGLSAATLTGGRSVPLHLEVKPERQRASAFERLVISLPVRRLVGRGDGFAHDRQLPRWIHEMNP